MKTKWISLFLLFGSMLYGHEGHHHGSGEIGWWHSVIHWVGLLHPGIVHFSLALIIMTGVSEALFMKYRNVLFDHASRFMLIGGAIWTIPAALCGWALSVHSNYEGALANLFWWHRFLGIFTTCLAIATVISREVKVRGIKTQNIYRICLGVLVVSAILTGYFGGEMTWGSRF